MPTLGPTSLSTAPCEGLAGAVAHMTLVRGKRKKKRYYRRNEQIATLVPQHTWVPGEGRIFPLTHPTSLQRAANQNWTGRVDITGVRERGGCARTFRSSMLVCFDSEAARRRMSDGVPSSFSSPHHARVSSLSANSREITIFSSSFAHSTFWHVRCHICLFPVVTLSSVTASSTLGVVRYAEGPTKHQLWQDVLNRRLSPCALFWSSVDIAVAVQSAKHRQMTKTWVSYGAEVANWKLTACSNYKRDPEIPAFEERV